MGGTRAGGGAAMEGTGEITIQIGDRDLVLRPIRRALVEEVVSARPPAAAPRKSVDACALVAAHLCSALRSAVRPSSPTLSPPAAKRSRAAGHNPGGEPGPGRASPCRKTSLVGPEHGSSLLFRAWRPASAEGLRSTHSRERSRRDAARSAPEQSIRGAGRRHAPQDIEQKQRSKQRGAQGTAALT